MTDTLNPILDPLRKGIHVPAHLMDRAHRAGQAVQDYRPSIPDSLITTLKGVVGAESLIEDLRGPSILGPGHAASFVLAASRQAEESGRPRLAYLLRQVSDALHGLDRAHQERLAVLRDAHAAALDSCQLHADRQVPAWMDRAKEAVRGIVRDPAMRREWADAGRPYEWVLSEEGKAEQSPQVGPLGVGVWLVYPAR